MATNDTPELPVNVIAQNVLVTAVERIGAWMLQVNGPEYASVRKDMRNTQDELETLRDVLYARLPDA